MKKTFASFPNMLLIGSSGRNAGKTHLATSIIRNNLHRTDIIGLKVTTIESKDGTCPHGKKGCGICSSMEGNHLLLEEDDTAQEKDTSLLLQAGAKRVFWLIVLEDKLDEGAKKLQDTIPDNSVIVAESNRLRLAVRPGLFIMLINPKSRIKQSAARVRSLADLIIETDGQSFALPIESIRYSSQGWKFEK
ncbi:MAG: hypothetical protein PVF22_00845 [Candidatus Aminicenantes bacterium]|jgi:hypothetical protein